MEGEGKNLVEEEDKKIILNNDKSVGRNVLTYLRIEEEKTFRIKFYNKFVCNLEAGYVRAHFGGHVFDSVCSSSKRLRNLFYNREVRERGVTRIEISVYGEQKRLNSLNSQNTKHFNGENKTETFLYSNISDT